jgi:hypothetical protein
MKPPLKAGQGNDFQTPPEALIPLLKFLNPKWKIWECASGQGNLVREFERLGFKVIASDILTGQNFLTWKPDKFDCIITNPPYSIKQDFLERCYALGKPFALLLPLTTFETTKRQELFKKHGVQVIFFDKRINFKTPTGKEGDESKAWFSTAWFTWGLGLKHELNFVKFGKEDNTEQSLLDIEA